jgi:hypothetical protein
LKKTNSQIILYLGFRLNYYSFYLAGLYFAFPEAKIQISRQGFPEIHHHCLAFRLLREKEEKIYISAGDGPGINEKGLEWCDVCGKVNYDPDSIPSTYGEKIMPIGPSFGIRIFSCPKTVFQALRMYVARGSGELAARRHFGDCYA